MYRLVLLFILNAWLLFISPYNSHFICFIMLCFLRAIKLWVKSPYRIKKDSRACLCISSISLPSRDDIHPTSDIWRAASMWFQNSSPNTCDVKNRFIDSFLKSLWSALLDTCGIRLSGLTINTHLAEGLFNLKWFIIEQTTLVSRYHLSYNHPKLFSTVVNTAFCEMADIDVSRLVARKCLRVSFAPVRSTCASVQTDTIISTYLKTSCLALNWK